MKSYIVAFVFSGAGLMGGYMVYPFVNPPSPVSVTQQIPSVSAYTVSCQLDEDQVKTLVERIAPSVAEHLITADLIAGDSNKLTQHQESLEQTRSKKESAFMQAQELVDNMVMNGNVNPIELDQAMQLLSQTGQEDKAYLLRARIAVAVNNGELTPQQAGYIGQFE